MTINGNKLRELRLASHIGQTELSKRIGVSQGMISQLEQSSRSCRPETLEKLAAELKCLPEELAGQSGYWIAFMRNCKKMTFEQLNIVDELVKLIIR